MPVLRAFLGLTGQSPGQGHDLRVERRQLGSDLIVVFEQKPLVDRLVEEPPGSGRGEAVEGAAGIEESQRLVERFLYVRDLVLGGVLPAFGLSPLMVDPLLLGTKDLLGDGVAVVELDELLLLGGQFAELPGVPLGFASGDLGLALDVLVQRAADGPLLFLGQHHAVMDALDGALDVHDADVGGNAVLPRPDTRQAAEVLVLSAVLGAVPAEAEASAAPATEDRAFEVVVVL